MNILNISTSTFNNTFPKKQPLKGKEVTSKKKTNSKLFKDILKEQGNKLDLYV